MRRKKIDNPFLLMNDNDLKIAIFTKNQRRIQRLPRHNVLCVHAGVRALSEHSTLCALDENVQRT